MEGIDPEPVDTKSLSEDYFQILKHSRKSTWPVQNGPTLWCHHIIDISKLLILCPFYYICVKRDLFFLFASQPVSWSRYIKAGNGSNKRDKQRKCLQTPIHAAVKRKCQIVNIIDMVCNLSISITYLGLSISLSMSYLGLSISYLGLSISFSMSYLGLSISFSIYILYPEKIFRKKIFRRKKCQYQDHHQLQFKVATKMS